MLLVIYVVVLDLVVLIRVGRRVLWLAVIGGGEILIGVNISFGVAKIGFEVKKIKVSFW